MIKNVKAETRTESILVSAAIIISLRETLEKVIGGKFNAENLNKLADDKMKMVNKILVVYEGTRLKANAQIDKIVAEGVDEKDAPIRLPELSDIFHDSDVKVEMIAVESKEELEELKKRKKSEKGFRSYAMDSELNEIYSSKREATSHTVH